MAARLINATPQASALHPARPAAAGSPCPIRCPTRTAAAELMPSGTMKVRLAIFRAIWWPASEAGSSRADQRGGQPRRRRLSSTTCMAAGIPSCSRRAEARPIRRRGDVKQSGAPHAIVVECAGDQHARHINARGEGGPGRSVRAHGAEAQMAVDQDPVAEQVDGIGGDQREHHRLDQADALQIPAEGEVQHQRQTCPSSECGYRRWLAAGSLGFTPKRGKPAAMAALTSIKAGMRTRTSRAPLHKERWQSAIRPAP